MCVLLMTSLSFSSAVCINHAQTYTPRRRESINKKEPESQTANWATTRTLFTNSWATSFALLYTLMFVLRYRETHCCSGTKVSKHNYYYAVAHWRDVNYNSIFETLDFGIHHWHKALYAELRRNRFGMRQNKQCL